MGRDALDEVLYEALSAMYEHGRENENREERGIKQLPIADEIDKWFNMVHRAIADWTKDGEE